MFQHQNIWLPDGEKHFPEWMTKNGEIVNGKGTYQIKKLRAALEYVGPQKRTAIDVGGHVGMWSMHLAEKFRHVHAFEPMEVFRECFVKNVTANNVTLHSCALGNDGPGGVGMIYDPADSGGTHVGGAGDILIRTLDSFYITAVDFIKIDCEGFELAVMQGARETILRERPTIIVEQKTHKLEANYGTKGIPAVDYAIDLGYVVKRVMSGDYIMVPK